MAEPSGPETALLIVGVMYREDFKNNKVKQLLTERFGDVLLQSQTFGFEFTSYYEEEMGKDLEKVFFIFKEKFDPSKLTDVKLITNEIEENFSDQSNRTVNIDPGYLTMDKVVVASCKYRPHRLYLQKGIYAHLMFFFKKDDLQTFKWTYPDYLTAQAKDVFKRARSYLLKTREKK